jgi:DNA-binding transcriptional LysR family regulator
LLFSEPLVVVAGIKNPWIRRRKIDLAELVNERWTWSPPGGVLNALMVEAFRGRGLKAPCATVYAQPTNMRIKLAETGRFLAVVTASVLTSVKMLPVELPSTRRQIGIITLARRTLSPLAQRFIGCAREVTKPLAKINS